MRRWLQLVLVLRTGALDVANGRRSADVVGSLLPPEALVMPAELARVGRRLDDKRFYAAFVPFSMPRMAVRRSRSRRTCALTRPLAGACRRCGYRARGLCRRRVSRGYTLGHPLVDRYLEFVAGRCRPNTVRAVALDLKVFFTVVDRDPVTVTPPDVFEFLAQQRGDRTVVRIADRESGLSARTIARRLSSVSGFYAYLVARGDTPATTNPVPRGLQTRRAGGRTRTVPLVRVPQTLPEILSPDEVDALLGALRTARDRAMVLAMLLGGLRRCEVLACA